MKKAVLTALFAGMVLSAGAQNTDWLVEEEPDIKVTEDTVRNTAIEEKVQQKYRFLPPPSRGTKPMCWTLSCMACAIQQPMICLTENLSKRKFTEKSTPRIFTQAMTLE